MRLGIEERAALAAYYSRSRIRYRLVVGFGPWLSSTTVSRARRDRNG
jgi:hypothetical protein